LKAPVGGGGVKGREFDKGQEEGGERQVPDSVHRPASIFEERGVSKIKKKRKTEEKMAKPVRQ